MIRIEELVCSSDMAKAVLSACDLGRGPVAAFLYDWQTLISGGLAILAALATVIYLRRQIALQQEQVDLQRDQYQQESRQKVKTALIGVPHALVEIHSYLGGCFDAWKAENPDDRPAPPTDALTIIMDAAAYVDDESFDSFRHLVIASQTFETRIASPGRQRAHNTLSTMIVDLAELSYLANRLLRFARMEPGAEAIPYVKSTRAASSNEMISAGGREFAYSSVIMAPMRRSMARRDFQLVSSSPLNSNLTFARSSRARAKFEAIVVPLPAKIHPRSRADGLERTR